MRNFDRNQKAFLRLLLNTSRKQQKILVEIIEKSQLNAVVPIVYNVMQGYRSLSNEDKKRLSRQKKIIRQFFSKGISMKRRRILLSKNLKLFLPFLAVVKSEL